jgi:hypothetical protein
MSAKPQAGRRELLARAAAGAAGRAAREGLTGVYGKGVNERIVAAMQAQRDLRRRADLIGVLETRKARPAAGALLKEAVGDDANVRRRAMSVLRRLAKLAQSAKAKRHRILALQGLVRTLALPSDRRRPEKRAYPEFDMALAAVRAALNDADAEVQEAAVRALAERPLPGAAPDLLKLARSAAKPNQRILALRGYIRLAGTVARGSARDALKMYKDALGAAARPDEKKQVLSGVSRLRSLDALNIAMTCLADEAVRAEAAAAAVSVADRIRSAHPREVRAAMEKVLAAAKSNRTRQRAQEILKGTPSKGRR